MDVQHTDWLNCITGKQWSLYLVSANNGLSTSFTRSVYVLQDEILQRQDIPSFLIVIDQILDHVRAVKMVA